MDYILDDIDVKTQSLKFDIDNLRDTIKTDFKQTLESLEGYGTPQKYKTEHVF
jgi:hypothetical protein